MTTSLIRLCVLGKTLVSHNLVHCTMSRRIALSESEAMAFVGFDLHFDGAFTTVWPALSRFTSEGAWV